MSTPAYDVQGNPIGPDGRPYALPVVPEMAASIAGDPAPEYPSTLQQAGNLLGAVARVAGAAVAGRPIRADDDEKARRLAICADCPSWDAPARRCRMCGCYTDYKLSLMTERCPAEKW